MVIFIDFGRDWSWVRVRVDISYFIGKKLHEMSVF